MTTDLRHGIKGPNPGLVFLAFEAYPHFKTAGIAGEIMAVALKSGTPKEFRTIYSTLQGYEQHIERFIDNKVTDKDVKGLPSLGSFYAIGPGKNSIEYDGLKIHFDDGSMLTVIEGEIPEVGFHKTLQHRAFAPAPTFEV